MRLIFSALVLLYGGGGLAGTLSTQDLKKIGHTIWRNESNNSEEKLVHWNKGEEFASMGIGHFIWYPAPTCPKGAHVYAETFPELVAFIATRGYDTSFIPATCPWHSYEEFMQHNKDELGQKLRQLLAKTVDVQVQYMFERLNRSLELMDRHGSDTACAKKTASHNVLEKVQTISLSAHGMYVLIDYVNFKGDGLSPQERYHNQGWGLLQVLEEMREVPTQNAIAEFVRAASDILKRRVDNAPPERHEERWLKGWLGRVNSYLTY